MLGNNLRGELRDKAAGEGAEGIVGAAESGVIVATSRIVAEYPEPQF